ncbi:MAG: InlB B-repeat-containing protein, partial [Clostridiales bacterium]|nr:InlB B-repeat-containing protein [Clostridiales bacterium]
MTKQYFKLSSLLALIIMTVAVALLCRVPCTGIASATAILPGEDSGFNMDEYRELYAVANDYELGNVPLLYYEMSKAEGVTYDLFEYIIGIDKPATGNNFCFRVSVREGDRFLYIEANNDCALSVSLVDIVDRYNGISDVIYEGKFLDPGNITMSVWLRYTNEDFTICTSILPPYYFGDVHEYFKSDVKRIFKKGSDEYVFIQDVLISATQYDCFQRDDESAPTVRERFGLYRSLTIPDLETPVKEGHTFTGWYYDKDCTQLYDGQPISSDTKLYPGWKINQYHVSFNDDVDGLIYAAAVDWNTPAVCKEPPTRPGKRVAYWQYIDGSRYNGEGITEDTALFAVYEPIYCTVTFDTKGGHEIEPWQVPYGQKFSILPTPVRIGYTFLYWALKDTEVNAVGKIVESDMTLEALWDGTNTPG